MDLHVNGWSTIAEYLERRKRTQNDLAVLLNISAAAVSQLKSGQYLLNPNQLAAIVDFLEFDGAAIDRFYTELFNARLLIRRGVHAPSFAMQRPRFRVQMNREEAAAVGEERRDPVPVARMEQLDFYEPALEPVDEFLLRNSSERYQGECRGEHLCVLRLERGNPFQLFPGTQVIFSGRRFAAPGDLTVAFLCDIGMVIREYVPEGERILMRPIAPGSGEEIRWRRNESPGLIRWMYPVTELVLKIPRAGL